MQHVIIGAGPAGVIAAETLRKNDASCSIKLIGDETEPPYSRMALPYYLIDNILIIILSGSLDLELFFQCIPGSSDKITNVTLQKTLAAQRAPLHC